MTLAARGTANTIFSIHFSTRVDTAHMPAHIRVYAVRSYSVPPNTPCPFFHTVICLAYTVQNARVRLCCVYCCSPMYVCVPASFCMYSNFVPVFVSPAPNILRCSAMLCTGTVVTNDKGGGWLMGKIYHENVRLRISFNRSKRRSFIFLPIVDEISVSSSTNRAKETIASATLKYFLFRSFFLQPSWCKLKLKNTWKMFSYYFGVK